MMMEEEDGGGYSDATTSKECNIDHMEVDAATWYEHVSKAGGTTFCTYINATIDVHHMPEYHCMPQSLSLRRNITTTVGGSINSYLPYIGTWTNDMLS